MKILTPLLALASALSMNAAPTHSSAAQSPVPSAQPPAHTFKIGTESFELDGKPIVIRCGEIHAPRVPREYWRHRLQMVRAMGMNAVCAYLFWNLHEPREGEYNWNGQADTAEFCRIAQEEGLWVILRPGPYACAEWEMGGLPWWLLKHDDIALRSRDPRFIAAARNYMKEVGRVFGPLQITRGGPILMVQVENEYGFYAKDAAYMGEIRQAILDAGFDVPLFACNPKQHLKDGYRSDLFPVVNFGTDPAGAFKALREILPTGPLMSGEFYPGWFDTWGNPHHRGNTPKYLADLETMLKLRASFSIYMAHGGTTFGLWQGADRPFKPDTTSYDYDAPISENGLTTEKFFLTRALMERFLEPGETLPAPPAPHPTVAYPAVTLTEWSPVLPLALARQAVTAERPLNFEKLDQARAVVVYRATLPAGPAGTLRFKAVHDFAWAFLDGKPLPGELDRRVQNFKLSVPARTAPVTIDLLVEAMGRVNFGTEVHDRKGLHGPALLEVTGAAPVEITGWAMHAVTLSDFAPTGIAYQSAPTDSAATQTPAFWRGQLEVGAKPEDTFLDVSNWGKGIVWINGHCLGRFWNIGPTQTLYVPGPWLKAGANEVIVLDLRGPAAPSIAGLEKPVLDQLRPELDFSGRREPTNLVLAGVQPVHRGEFAPGSDSQTVKFTAPATGRFFCLEALDAHDGKTSAAIAELDLLDADGQPISHEGWVIAYVSSEERTKEDGTAENAIDGQTANIWHNEYSGRKKPKYPHHLVIDLGASRTVSALRYIPRQGAGNVSGRIKSYNLYLGDGLVTK